MTDEELHAALGGDGLASRTMRVLRRYGWIWLGNTPLTAKSLSEIRRDELLDMHNFGPQSLARVEAWLKREGLSLRPSPWEAS